MVILWRQADMRFAYLHAQNNANIDDNSMIMSPSEIKVNGDISCNGITL